MIDLHVNTAGVADVPVGLIAAAVRSVLDIEGMSVAEISVTIVDDRRIQELNERYLAHDRVTDVISFRLSNPLEPLLGDIYIGFEQAVRQACGVGVSVEEELARLAIHGTLHLLGHDHPEGNDREESPMWLHQENLLARLLDAES